MRAVDAQALQSTHRRARQLAALLLAAFSAVLSTAPVGVAAAEQAEEFLQGLNERGLHELALVYLQRMDASRLADEQFRRKIPFHRGVVLIAQSRQSADPAVRARLLDEARLELEKFAGSNPEGVQGAEAQLQLATMQLERGQQLVVQTKQLPGESVYDGERRQLGQEARRQFSAARATLENAAAIYSAELENLPPTAAAEANADQGSRRQEYRGRLAQLRFLAAQTRFEAAQSYPPEDDEFRPLHESAAQEFAALFDEFSRSTGSLVGLYARLYEGRCYHALGQYPMALGCYEDILAQPNVLLPFRKLIASAVHRKAETLLAQEKGQEAIDLCRACLRDARAGEEKMPEWLAVRFRCAQAADAQASRLAAGSAEQRKLLAEAREAYRFVAASPGEFQLAARSAVGTLARGNAATKDEPQSFQAAYDSGKDALASYNAAKLALPTAEKNNPAAVRELRAQMEHGKEDARRYFRLATTLVEEDSDPARVNEVRYFLCWLYWEAEDYYRAAVLGEFLARRFPDHAAASSAAKLSMASYERLYSRASAAGAANSGNTDFEARRMALMAEFIARRWPGTDDADAAFGVLVSYAIRNNRIEEAERLLAEASAPSRPRLELQLGNALWGRYLELSQRNSAGSPDDAALERLKQSALKYLRSGYENAGPADQASEAAATAGLYLAQALLSDGQFDQAVNLLEDQRRGPLTLIAEGHAAASQPLYVVEAYKAALRAYVLSTPPQEQKAVAAMKSLEQAVRSRGDDGLEAAEQLTRIFLALGVALQKQIDELHRAGRGGEAQRLTTAFTKFLERIGTQSSQIDWPTGMWLAQTYYNLGTDQRSGPSQRSGPPSAPADQFESAPAPASGASREYLVKARDGYRKLLAAAANSSQFAPTEAAVLAAKVQLGECYGALGEYQSALDTYSEVLKEKEASLTVQRAAAYAYQQRGQLEDAKWFERAIHGGYQLRSTGQNRIWGWLKISQVAARAARSDEKYQDAFYEACLNMARCRYLAALKSQGSARQQHLSKARQSIQSLARLYPDLGGERWRGQFEALLKQIQAASKT
jgi:tetratricopeptide (TPR) repeat protein